MDYLDYNCGSDFNGDCRKTEILREKIMKSRKAMVKFLTEHFRYNTMNSWNASTSYAANLKIPRVIPRDLQDKAFELLDAEGFYDPINGLIADFDAEHGHLWQAGFNGRSGGYLVLYVGSVENITLFDFDGRPEKDIKPDDRDYADHFGWLSFTEAKERGLYNKPSKRIGCFAGKSVDMGEDFADWDMDSLRERVKLVQEFDALCKDIITSTIDMCKTATVETKTRSHVETYKSIAGGD